MTKTTVVDVRLLSCASAASEVVGSEREAVRLSIHAVSFGRQIVRLGLDAVSFALEAVALSVHG